MRRRKIPGALEKFHTFKQYVIHPDQEASHHIKQFIGSGHLYIEVGMGRGDFLIQMAQKFPDRLFLGVEIKEELLLKAAEKAELAQVENLKLILADSATLPLVMGENKAHGLYLNFSDPWPKDRHAKRRLTHALFLKCYKEILIPGGRIEFKTDNKDLFTFTMASFEAFGLVVKSFTEDLYALGDQDNVASEYEKKFVAMNHPIYRICASV